MLAQYKQIEDQNKQIEDQNKRIEDQNKQTEEQKKEIVNLNKKHNENQDSKETVDQQIQIVDNKKQIEDLQQCLTKHLSSLPLSMIIPNIEDESCYSPICTAFQWKFKPTELKSGIIKFSAPFYNIMNAHCFQLRAEFANKRFNISLLCRRGKYDHNMNKIDGMKKIDFRIHIFGKNGISRIYQWDCKDDYSIRKHETLSDGWAVNIFNNDIDSLTVDGYVHSHCFFNNID